MLYRTAIVLYRTWYRVVLYCFFAVPCSTVFRVVPYMPCCTASCCTVCCAVLFLVVQTVPCCGGVPYRVVLMPSFTFGCCTVCRVVSYVVILYHVVPYRVVHYGVGPNRVVPYRFEPYRPVPCRFVPCSMVPYRTADPRQRLSAVQPKQPIPTKKHHSYNNQTASKTTPPENSTKNQKSTETPTTIPDQYSTTTLQPQHTSKPGNSLKKQKD